MKPWEETWHSSEDQVLGPDRGDIVAECVWRRDEAHHFATARLLSAAPDMVRVLLSIEWLCFEDSVPTCPVCEGMNSDGPLAKGHEKDCALDAALKKAGVR